MPVVELPVAVAALANVAFWAVAHATSGYVAHCLPATALAHDGRLLRLRGIERAGRLYERTLRIRSWKDRLPEAGDLFTGGVSKRRLPGRGRDGIEGFVRETRRAELAHWMCLVPLPMCALWNPPVGFVAMVVYGFAVNLPFIAVQRYNRSRCQRVLTTRTERSSRSRSRADGEVEPPTNGNSIP